MWPLTLEDKGVLLIVLLIVWLIAYFVELIRLLLYFICYCIFAIPYKFAAFWFIVITTSISELFDLIPQLFTFSGRYKISTAKCIKLNQKNGEMHFLFPYQDRFLTLTHGYWRLNSSNNIIPKDVIDLIFNFHGSDKKKKKDNTVTKHYTFTYNLPQLMGKPIGITHASYIAILHDRQQYVRGAIPTMIFGVFRYITVKCIICNGWIEDKWNLLNQYCIGIAIKILCFICLPIVILLSLLMSWMYAKLISRCSVKYHTK